MSAITTAPGSSFVRASAKSCLVLLLLGVEEDDVEHVVDALERLERVALDSSAQSESPASSILRAPGLDLRRVVLEREHATTQVADAGGEPDRGVAAGTTDLEHLAVGLRRDVREQELSRRAGDLARTLLARHAPGALVRVLCLETGEHGANAVVEHYDLGSTTRVTTQRCLPIVRSSAIKVAA